MRYLTMLTMIGGLVLLGNAALAVQEITLTGTVYQTVNVRSGPDTQYEIVAKLEAGQEVVVDGRESEATRWLHVRLEETEEVADGWITAFSVMLADDPAQLPIIGDTPPEDSSGDSAAEDPQETSVIVSAYGRVNVRSGPGIEYDVVGQLNESEEAAALARSNHNSDWLYIEQEALTGWVAYFTVNVSGDPAALPVRVPDGSNTELVPPSALATTRYNVRLRVTPEVRASVVGIVPFNSDITPIAQTEDGRWLYVWYEDMEGWALAQLFELSDGQRASIPVFTPGSDPVPPSPTPQPTLAPAEVTPEVEATEDSDS